MTSFGDSMRRAMDSELIEPPRGPYNVHVEEASAFEGKDGRQWAKLILKITDGDHAGALFQHFMGFQPDSIKQMNGNACAAYGVDWTQVQDITDLDDQLTAIAAQDTTAQVSVAYKDGYMNVNVHGSRTAGVSDIPGDGYAQAATNGGADDDSVPF